MTLVLVWPSSDALCVIADTRLNAGQKVSVDAAPKIYAVPIVLHSPTLADGPQRCAPMGFTFAGHTAAGHMTSALATAGLQALWSDGEPKAPKVEQVADYFARCAVTVVEDIRSHYPQDLASFEGLVFGWEDKGHLAYTFEVIWEHGPKAIAQVELMDFDKFGMYAIGKGHHVAQAHIDNEWQAGRKATAYSALKAVIADESERSVGGSLQCAITTKHGTELKAVLEAEESGQAFGGFMGAGGSHLGMIGELAPFGSGPVVLGLRTTEFEGECHSD